MYIPSSLWETQSHSLIILVEDLFFVIKFQAPGTIRGGDPIIESQLALTL